YTVSGWGVLRRGPHSCCCGDATWAARPGSGSRRSAARDLEGGIDLRGPGQQSAFEMRRRSDAGTDGQSACRQTPSSAATQEYRGTSVGKLANPARELRHGNVAGAFQMTGVELLRIAHIDQHEGGSTSVGRQPITQGRGCEPVNRAQVRGIA